MARLEFWFERNFTKLAIGVGVSLILSLIYLLLSVDYYVYAMLNSNLTAYYLGFNFQYSTIVKFSFMIIAAIVGTGLYIRYKLKELSI